MSAGCSWTDKNFKSTDPNISKENQGGWPMWPEIVSSKLNIHSKNLGFCGTDNGHIFNSVVDEVHSNKNIKFVIVAWTSWDRFDYMGNQKHPIGSFAIANSKEYKGKNKIYPAQPEFDEFFFNMNTAAANKYSKATINNNLRYIFLLSDILNNLNIDYIFLQALSPFPLMVISEINEIAFRYDEKSYLKDLIGSQYHNKIYNDDNIIGYPFMKVFNGYNLNHILNDDDDYISKLDKHPNRHGQMRIANHIMEIISDRNINI